MVAKKMKKDQGKAQRKVENMGKWATDPDTRAKLDDVLGPLSSLHGSLEAQLRKDFDPDA